MNGRLLLAILITALGAVITVANLRGGLEFSFPLLLGVLLVADGLLRFAMLRDDAESHQPRAD